MNLTKEQQAILDYDGNMFIQGPAGTGKSTMISLLANKYKKENKTVAVMATTGIAAINVNGVTLHSGFRIPIRDHYINEHVKFNPNLKMVDVFIIDEGSMLRADILDYIDQMLKAVMTSAEPFGGKKIIILGDLYQLPPVLRLRGDLKHEFDAEYATEYFFSAHSFKNNFKTLSLNKVFRQQSLEYIEKLRKVRHNDAPDLNYFNKYFTYGQYDEDGPIIASTNKEVQGYNQAFLNQLEGEEINLKDYHYYVNREGDNYKSKGYIDTPDVKIGAKVMIRVNNGRTYVNGTIGILEEVHDNYLIIRTDDDLITFPKYAYFEAIDDHGSIVAGFIEEGRLNQIEDKYKVTYFEIGFPITLAWAFTVHKSQGLQFEKLNIDPGRIFAPYQLYVALSRLKDPNGLTLLSKIKPKHVITDNRVVTFMNK